MKITVIIPTYKRVKDLEITLNSLCWQQKLPDQTLIIDQSPDEETKTLCQKEIYKKIHLQYIHYNHASLAKARNFWIQKIDKTSDIIQFFDDDVIMNSYYLEKVAHFLSMHPDALGGGGQVKNEVWHPTKLWYILFANTYITYSFWTKDAQKKDPTKIQAVKTLCGHDMFFRKSVFDQWYRFPEWMEKYSHREDSFFSLQITQDHPNTLFYFPEAKIKHFQSPAGRIIKKEAIKQITCHLYIYFKQFHFPLWKFYRQVLGFCIKEISTNKNKAEIISSYYQSIVFLLQNKGNITKIKEKLNTFIFGEK